jgi:hypothetical protein
MTIGKLTTLAVTAALSLLACDARTLIGMVPDAGTNPPDGSQPSSDASAPDAGPGTQGHTCTPVVFPGDARYTLPAGVAGTWTGYFQGGSPLPTSDVIKLSLQQASDGSGEIRVTFGTAAAPPPATSATDYYPPGTSTDPLTARFPGLVEGASYLAHAVTWQGTRLKFQLSEAQPWESWCALQTSYFVVDRNEYNCAPGFGGAVANEPGGPMCVAEDLQGRKQTPIPCGQFSPCSGQYCTCDACGCAGGVTNTRRFAVTFDGDLVTGVDDGHNVRLTRDTKRHPPPRRAPRDPGARGRGRVAPSVPACIICR